MEKEMRLLNNFRQPMVSLERLCAVQVNTEIIKAGCVDNHAAIDSLEIPIHLKSPMKALMQSMVTSFHWHWHQDVHLEGGPIFYPDGTMDMRRSTRVFVEDESLDVGTRFLLATTYCHEHDVFKLSPKLTKGQLNFRRGCNDKHSDIHILIWKHGTYYNLWRKIINALGAAEGPDHRLVELLCAEGVRDAWRMENYAAMSYFSCKTPTDILTDIVKEERHRLKPYDGAFTPLRFSMVFLKMDEVEKERFKSDSHNLLEVHAISRELHIEHALYEVPKDPFDVMLCFDFLELVLFHTIYTELTDEEHLVRTLLRLQPTKIEKPRFETLRLLQFLEYGQDDEV